MDNNNSGIGPDNNNDNIIGLGESVGNNNHNDYDNDFCQTPEAVYPNLA